MTVNDGPFVAGVQWTTEQNMPLDQLNTWTAILSLASADLPYKASGRINVFATISRVVAEPAVNVGYQFRLAMIPSTVKRPPPEQVLGLVTLPDVSGGDSGFPVTLGGYGEFANLGSITLEYLCPYLQGNYYIPAGALIALSCTGIVTGDR